MTTKRAETGPMRFGDDWPGLFIRGDNAMYYATMVRLALAHVDGIARPTLEGLAELLESAREGKEPHPDLQVLPDFKGLIAP